MQSIDPLSPPQPLGFLPKSDTPANLSENVPPDPSVTMGVYDEILRTLAHGDGIDAAFALLTQKAQILTDCASATVALLSPDRETLTFTAALGPDADDMIGSRVLSSDTLLGKTARTGEPSIFYRRLPAPTGDTISTGDEVVSAAVVAIFDEGQPVGAVAAMNKRENKPFRSDDLMALSTLAAAASVVLRNSRLRTDSIRQGRELSTLYEAVRSVSGKLSVQEVVRAVVEQAAAHMENSAVVIFLANDEGTHLYIAEDIGLDDFPDQREVILSARNGLGAAAIAKNPPLNISFVSGESDLPLHGTSGKHSPEEGAVFETPFIGLGARSGLSAPIRSGDSVQGFVLVLSRQPPGLYTKADANLLGALASQAAVAMENAWLYEDANRRAAEAAALYDLSQAVTSTLRLPQVLHRIVDSVLTLLDVDKFALFLYDTNDGRLKMVVERGLAEGAADRIQPAFGQGIPGWVMEFETPTAVQDVAADHRNASAPLHTEGIVSMTCMPLQSGISTTGVLCALSSRRRLFTVAETELLYTITNQAAIAIENARMYADVQQKSRELRKYFHRVSRALGSSRSPKAIPELIAALTQEITDASCCALYSTALPGLVVEASVGLKITELTATGGAEMPAQWVARRGRALAIASIEDDGRFRETAPRAIRGKVVSYLGVPLHGPSGRRDIIGVLEIYTRERREWRAEEIRLLITFASQAAVALQSAQQAERSIAAQRYTTVLESLLALVSCPENLSTSQKLLELAAQLFDNDLPMPIIIFRSKPDAPEVWFPTESVGLSQESVHDVWNLLKSGDSLSGVTSRDKSTYLYIEKSDDGPVSVLQSIVELLANAPEKDIDISWISTGKS